MSDYDYEDLCGQPEEWMDVDDPTERLEPVRMPTVVMVDPKTKFRHIVIRGSYAHRLLKADGCKVEAVKS